MNVVVVAPPVTRLARPGDRGRRGVGGRGRPASGTVVEVVGSGTVVVTGAVVVVVVAAVEVVGATVVVVVVGETRGVRVRRQSYESFHCSSKQSNDRARVDRGRIAETG